MFKERRMTIISKNLVFLVAIALMIGLIGSVALPQEKVTLKWWAEADPGSRPQWVARKGMFEAAYPNIKVDFEEFPQLLQKNLAAFASGTEPDILPMYGRNVGSFMESELLLPLTPDYITEEELQNRIFLAPAKFSPFVNSKGQRCGLPAQALIVRATAMVNLKLWEKAGLGDFPKTWDEFMTAARKMTIREGGKLVQAGLGHNSWDTYGQIYTFIKQFGGEYFNRETEKHNFTSPEALEALQFFKDAYLEVNGLDILNDYEGFVQERIGILMTQSWTWGSLRFVAPQMVGNVAHIRIPGVGVKEGVPPYILCEEGDTLAISVRTKHPDEAAKFVLFAISTEPALATARLYPWVITSREAWERPDYAKKDGELYFTRVLIDMLKNEPEIHDWTPNITTIAETNRIMGRVWGEILGGALSVEEGAKLMEREVNDTGGIVLAPNS